MPEWMEWTLVALAALNLILLVGLLLRRSGGELQQEMRDDNERVARELRGEVQDSARGFMLGFQTRELTVDRGQGPEPLVGAPGALRPLPQGLDQHRD